MTLLPMENRESVLCALKSFEQEKPATIPPILEDYIKQISQNGQTLLPWVYVKPLLLHKYNLVVESFPCDSTLMNYGSSSNNVHLSELKQQVYNCFKRFDGIPFTIQRICELFDNPSRHYKRVDKFLRGLEKVCMVVSTVDPHGNKIHREDPRFPSRMGFDDNGLVNGAVSPPGSPSIDSLQVNQHSKSSDEEATEDDDDIEDTSSDYGDERRLVSSPRSSLSMNSSLLGNTTPTNSWLFKTHNASGLPHTPPMNFRNSAFKGRLNEQSTANTNVVPNFCGNLLTAYSSDKDDEYEQIKPTSEVKSVVRSLGFNDQPISSLSTFGLKPDLSNDHTADTPIRSTSLPDHASVMQTIKGDDTIMLENSRSFQDEVESSPITTSTANTGSETEGNGLISSNDEATTSDVFSSDSSVKQTMNSISAVDTQVSTSNETVSTVSHILRPIGQLEAFVQNLNSEVSGSTITPFNTTIPSGLQKTSIMSPSASCPPNSENTQIDKMDLSSPVLLKSGIRRPRSPVNDSVGYNLQDSIDECVPDPHESPAKRCKLVLTESHESSSGSQASTTETTLSKSPQPINLPTTALNDSPPIILCNPSHQVRDRDSGECLVENEPPNLEQAPLNSPNNELNIDPQSDSNTIQSGFEDHFSTSSSNNEVTIPAFVISSSHINSETGEEEEP